jgi:TonB family protein
MTVRQAFSISLAAHILIFGSAFAIAQYGRGLFRSTGDAMTVVLVYPGQTSGSSNGPVTNHIHASTPLTNQVHSTKSKKPSETIKDQAQEVKYEKSFEPTLYQSNDAESEIPAEAHREPGQPATLPSDQISTNMDVDKNDGEPGPSASARQGASAQFGIAAPPEWAILAAAIERTKNYPRLARERGIEGVVRLRFRLTTSGSVERLEILQSSGSEVLDNASISAVYRAVPLPYVNGWVEIPMKYVLK